MYVLPKDLRWLIFYFLSHTPACFRPCRVFVLADPEVFSDSLGQVLVDDFEASASASGGFLSPLDLMRSVVQHSIQAALGSEQCHGPKLAQALKVSGTEQHFTLLVVLSYCLLF